MRKLPFMNGRMECTAMCLLLLNLLLARPCAALGLPPIILLQPASQTVPIQDSATFSVTASSFTTMTFQWYFNNISISGATQNSFTITHAQTTNQGTYKVVIINGGGQVTSSGATLTVLTPPTITTQPADQAVVAGQEASFSVTASSSSSMSYQWNLNGTQLSGDSEKSTLTISNAQTNQAGNYTVVVNNSIGSVTSAVATLTVYVPPSITSQPQNQTVIEGQNVLLSVAASGTAPISYQWQATNTTGGGFTNLTTGGQIAGANTNLLEISNVAGNNALFYQVIITNAYGAVTSSPAFLKVVPPVLVDVQFLGASGTTWPLGSGSPQTGAAVLGASGDIWNQEGLPYYIYPGTATDINAATLVNSANLASGLSLTVGSSANSVFGGHQANVPIADPATSNLMSSAIEQFVLSANVDVWTITVGGLSAYAGDQFNLVVYAGAPSAKTQTISVTGGASGGNTSSPLTTSSTDLKLSNGAGDAFQIFTNGTLNGSNLVFTVNGGTAAVDAYSAFVNGFQLQIYGNPVITTQPASQTNVAGSTVQFSMGASGGLLGYQWQANGGSGFVNVENGGIFSGATSNILTLTGATGSSAVSYQVIVTNSFGSVTSAPATLSLSPKISTQPASLAATTGGDVSFSVAADGSAPLSYRWFFQGNPLSNATNSTLVFNPLMVANGGNYSVVVANSYGSVTSSVATLTVAIPNFTLSTFPASGVSTGPPSNGFTFQLPVPVGCTYIILASTDLQNWTPIATNVAESAIVAITDVSATNYSRRFYRAVVH
jgi:hypothetical protein